MGAVIKYLQLEYKLESGVSVIFEEEQWEKRKVILRVDAYD